MWEKIKRCPSKAQDGLGKLFGIWGAFVERCTLLVFIVTAAGFFYAALGL